MAQLNKTLHIKKGGTEHTAKLYTTTAETGGTYGFLKVDGQQVYYALGSSSDGRATYGRVKKSGTGYAILNSGRIPYHRDNYTTAGTYSWTCPQGVTRVKVTIAGGGGGAAGLLGYNPHSGGRGEQVVKNAVSVNHGTVYTIKVGAGGVTSTQDPREATAGSPSSAFGVTARGGGAGNADGNGVSYTGGGAAGTIVGSGTNATAVNGATGWVYIEYGGGI